MIAGKARKSEEMRRTVLYAAMTEDEAQRSIRTFYEHVKNDNALFGAAHTPDHLHQQYAIDLPSL